MVLLLAITRVVRKEWIAAILFCGIMTFGFYVRGETPFELLGYLLRMVVVAAVMLRFGVFATAVCMSLFQLAIAYPITGFSGPWWAGGRMTLLATIVVVAAYGAWCCARRPVPERE